MPGTAYDGFERSIWLRVTRDSRQGLARVAFTEAEAAQRSEILRMDVRAGDRRKRAVRRCRSMEKVGQFRCGTGNLERALVNRAMVSVAERDEVAGIVETAIGARPNVMHIHESCAGATWSAATMAVATQHLAAGATRPFLGEISRSLREKIRAE